MQITETNTDGLKREFKVVIASSDIEANVQSRLTEIGKTVRLPGFRPGKVPMPVLKQRFGASVMGEVLEKTVSDTSSEAMRERNLRPALQPNIEILSFNEGQDLEYKLAVEVLPDIGTPSFADVEIERLLPEIPNEDIDAALERLAQQRRKSEPVDRPAAKGDITVIDFLGSIDGTPFAGGAASDFSLELGSGSFIPGFEDQLVGAAKGEKRTVKVAFPADYGNEDLAGKDAEFAVEIKDVKEQKPQAIDESLAEAVGMENLEALRDAVRSQIERDYNGIARQRLKRELLDVLAERHHFDVPQGMVDLEFDAIWKQYEAEKERLKEANKDAPEAATDSEAKSDDEVKAEYRAIAERRVRLGLLLSEVGRNNNITVTQDELNRALSEEARRYPGNERQVLDFYREHPEALGNLRAPIFEDKVIDFILEIAKVTDRKIPAKELIAAEEEGEAEEEAKPAKKAAKKKPAAEKKAAAETPAEDKAEKPKRAAKKKADGEGAGE